MEQKLHKATRMIATIRFLALLIALTAVAHAENPHIIFLNFSGATLTHPNGGDDSTADRSLMVDVGATITLAPFDATAYAPARTVADTTLAITSLVKQFYAPF